MAADGSEPARGFEKGRFDGLHDLFYSRERILDRFLQPSILISILLLLVTVAYRRRQTLDHDNALGPRTFSDYLFDILVHLIPAGLVFAVDHWLNPPLFPTHMLQAPVRTQAAKGDALVRILRMAHPVGLMKSAWNNGPPTFMTYAGAAKSIMQDVAGVTRRADDEPAGLRNWDNSCYQNSILQALASLKPLPEYLRQSAQLSPPENLSKAPTAESLRRLLDQLGDSCNNGRTLPTPEALKRMSTWQQQDAQEYFSKLLDEVDKDLVKELRAGRTHARLSTSSDSSESDDSNASVDSGYQSLSSRSKPEVLPEGNPLEGLVAQRVACVSCGYSEGLSMIPFNCLTLSLGLDSFQYDLYERLDNYAELESIQGVDCPKCTLLKLHRLLLMLLERGRAEGQTEESIAAAIQRLKRVDEALADDMFDDRTVSETCMISRKQRVSSTKTKQTVIARPPRSLAIHLNRSVFDERTGYMFKNTAAVRFPMTLDLGPWCLGSASTKVHSQRSDKPLHDVENEQEQEEEEEGEESWLQNPRASMVAGDKGPSRFAGPIYELRAVVAHQGRHENGHYICYRKHTSGTPAEMQGKLFKDSFGHANAVSESTPVDDPNINMAEADAASNAVGPEADKTERRDESCQWWRLSDEQVTPSSEEDVLAEGGVFMLFYDCIDPHTLFVGAPEQFHDTGSPSRKRKRPDMDVDEGATSSSGSGSEDGQPKQMVGPVHEDLLTEAFNLPLPLTVVGEEEL
jgi:ubiquitin carboxyl-terminal hydrolase 1